MVIGALIQSMVNSSKLIHMSQSPADIYAVQKILGHSHIRTAQRYAHQSPEYLENQIGVLD